ncbi:FAD-dependent oxidoreductase [Brumimicrobium aurantiacum]|uniref:Kynurenine 3-monooxygenase n=1 Tax=Brumimicrobium aurantiacum TaxID=1737063 RepID=A0A3E1EXF1_9FLAO|nr:NAD(P)/FAD-dependent oxidoreductase [Brumimicrobium aurantiacum]RFC54235.1 FAD-dependent monooxygenase [Brumimicrobium aurantiacum]
MEEKKVAVVGAGLVGSLFAVLLAKKGMEVDVFERRPDLRKAKEIGGRSINLALSNRGFKALELAGFAQEIRDISIPMYGRKMHDVEGNLTYQAYGKDNEAIYSVSRGELNRRLMNLADDYENVKYRFDRFCEDINLKENKIEFINEVSKDKEHYAYDHIFGADGAFSAVRGVLQKTPMFNYSQEYLAHGYKELSFPPNEDGTHRFDKNCLHIWPRGEFMMIALPNLDGSFTVTLFFPHKGETSFESLDTEEKVMDFFKATFPDAVPHMPTLVEDYFANPTSNLVTVRCSPWNYEDKVLLLGDASHAVVPFYGQGLNSGLEDCSVFFEMYEKYNGNVKEFFEAFSEQRVPDGNAIADLALYNYIEMRDLAGDKDFLLRKKIERKFSDLYPNKWMPLYSQVTFSHIRYSEALAAGNRQRKIMDEVMEMENIHECWDDQKVIDKILTLV